jgi:hypothetical protein
MLADLSHAEWKKAALSAHNGGCVEIAAAIPGAPGMTGIRDSKAPQRGAHVIPDAAFAAFLTDTRNGRYTL